jgi:hypothetical protein
MRHLSLCALSVLVSSLSFAAQPTIGQLVKASGTVLQNGQAAEEGAALHPNDRLETGKDSKAILRVGDARILMKPEAELKLSKSAPELEKGGVQVHVVPASDGKTKPHFFLKTKSATMGVRGTTFFAEQRGDSVFFCDCEGKISVSSGKDQAEYVSKHHDNPVMIGAGKDSLAARTKSGAGLPPNHSDSDAAELMAIK